MNFSKNIHKRLPFAFSVRTLPRHVISFWHKDTAHLPREMIFDLLVGAFIERPLATTGRLYCEAKHNKTAYRRASSAVGLD